MPLSILLHLPRGEEDRNANLATTALKPAVQRLGFRLRRVPTRAIPGAMADLESNEVLCVDSASGLSADQLRCLRWAVHKRYSADVEHVHRQLLCDLNNGDESRVRRPRQSRRRRGD